MINKRVNEGWIDKVQPQDLDVLVPGAGTSGEEDIAKRPDSESFGTPKEHPENAKANGNNHFGGK